MIEKSVDSPLRAELVERWQTPVNRKRSYALFAAAGAFTGFVYWFFQPSGLLFLMAIGAIQFLCLGVMLRGKVDSRLSISDASLLDSLGRPFEPPAMHRRDF